MKKWLLITPTLFSLYIANAQLCNEITDTKIKQIQEACSGPAFQNARAYDSLRRQASGVFDLLEKCAARNPSYEARAKTKKLQVYFSLTELSGQIGNYAEMLKNIEAMERILPSPTAISASSLSAFSIDGSNFTSNVSGSYVQQLYYEIIERRVNYYYFSNRNNSKVIEWYQKLSNAPSDFEPAALEALLYADAMHKTKPIKEYFPAMAKAATLMGRLWAKKEEHDSAEINNRSLMINWFEDEITDYNRSKLNNADPDGTYRMMAAHGLWDSDEKALAKSYALSASESGFVGKADGLWYLDIAAGNEAKHITAALRILERSGGSLSENEMDRLLPLAEKYGISGLVDQIRHKKRQIANLRRRSNISLFPAVELAGLPFGHVPVSLNLRTGRVMQEFMFDYVWGAKSRYRFGRAFEKGNAAGPRYKFSGWDAGYAINVIVGKDFKQGNKKGGRSSFFAPALGLDFRYAHWNLDPIVSNILDDNGNVSQSSALVHATTTRYELCYRTTFVFMTRFVTIQYYMGLGIGYRKLTTAEGYDVKNDRFQDQRLSSDRWNKLYMPLRLGVKIGLNIL